MREGCKGSACAAIVGEIFSDVGIEVFGVVVGGFSVVVVGVGFDVADTPPVKPNPARVAVQSLLGSCWLRNAASASKGTIAGICVVGGGCARCGLGGLDSAAGWDSDEAPPAVDARLMVAFFFAMAVPAVVCSSFCSGWWFSEWGLRLWERECR